jgi:hypothetical protein
VFCEARIRNVRTFSKDEPKINITNRKETV